MLQKEDAMVLIVGSVEEQRQHSENDPVSFLITDHYVGYPAILVRPTVDQATFIEMLERSWRRVARKRDLASYTDA